MLPPYARAIVNERDAGRHPPGILMAIHDEWVKVQHAVYPFVFVPEADFLAGKYDFWFCAGLPVFLRAGGRESPSWLALAGELGAVTAPVTVFHPIHCPLGLDVADLMSDIAHGKLFGDAVWVDFIDENFPWPQWWTWARDEAYRGRAAAAMNERLPGLGREPDRAVGAS